MDSNINNYTIKYLMYQALHKQNWLYRTNIYASKRKESVAKPQQNLLYHGLFSIGHILYTSAIKLMLNCTFSQIKFKFISSQTIIA